MKEPYLLAASLLTGLAIPTSTFPQMSSIALRNIGFSWDLPHLEESGRSGGGKIFAQVVSDGGLSATQASPFNHSSPPTTPSFVSGDQLYRERLLSLKTGEIFTRIDDENLHASRRSAKKHQLTYEDWKNLLAMEAKAVAQGQGKNRLSILVGDSLSMWFPKEKLPSGKLWLNQGISGDTSNGVLKRLSAFSGTKAEAIYLMVGINDLRQGDNDMSILHNFRHIIHRLRHTHTHSQIIVQSILPVRVTSISNSHIRQLNSKIAWIAQQEGAQYLNIHHWFTDTTGNLRPELTTDGIHLSSEGYDVWRASIQQIEFKLLSRGEGTGTKVQGTL
jgi:lysophospholipase L1-like esterase